MADATSTYVIDNSQDWPVVALNYCTRITVQENYDSTHAPTADLLQKMPATASAIRIPMGTPAIYTPTLSAVLLPASGRVFIPGQTVGTIRAAAGSVTVSQVEHSSI